MVVTHLDSEIRDEMQVVLQGVDPQLGRDQATSEFHW